LIYDDGEKAIPVDLVRTFLHSAKKRNVIARNEKTSDHRVFLAQLLVVDIKYDLRA
jgi:hypothetical protein